jgi:hypothetical protein
VMNGLVGYLTDNCCAAESVICCPAPSIRTTKPRRKKAA